MSRKRIRVSPSHPKGSVFRRLGWIVSRSAVYLILLASIALHVILIPAPGWERDLYWHDVWMRIGLEHGVPFIPDHVWCDYPPGYLYLLKFIGFFWTTLAGDLPPEGSITMRYLLKLMPLLGDLAGSVMLYHIARRRLNRASALAVLAAYAFNPALVFNSAVWGQADSVLSALVLATAYSIVTGRAFWGFAIMAAVILIKFQAIVLLPLLIYAVWRMSGFNGIRHAYLGLLSAGGLILLPCFAVNRVDWVIKAAFGASGRYPFLSMNAANIWWLYGRKDSMDISDALRLGNTTLSFYALGMMIFVFASALILWRLVSDRDRSGTEAEGEFFLACGMQFLAFYLFPTQMHERYIVPAVIFFAAAAIYRRVIWPFYLILSGIVCWSLASTLKQNYSNGLGGLGRLLDSAGLSPLLFPESRVDYVILSIIFLGLFVALVFLSKNRRYLIGASGAILGFAAIVAAIAFAPRHNDVILSDWDPVIAYQGWGSLMRNRTVVGERLEPHGFIFKHGIGTHAWSWLKYHTNSQFSFFETGFSIDYRGCGNWVQFRIFGEFLVGDIYERRLLYESPMMSSADFPQYARVSIADAEFLVLEVSEGPDGRNCDHVAWLHPVLIR